MQVRTLLIPRGRRGRTGLKRESFKKKQKVNFDHPPSASSKHEKEISQDNDQIEKVHER